MPDLVLVIGGHGCLGSRVVDAVQCAGAEAVPASRSAPYGVRLDVLDVSSFRSAEMKALRPRVTHVVFGAGSAHPGQPLTDLDVHLRGVANVLAWAADAPALERVVLVSSMLVYGDSARPRVTGLDFGQGHDTVYGFAKQRSEEFVLDSGLPARRVRLGLLLGDSDTGRLPSEQPIAEFARLCLRLPVLPLAHGGEFPAWTVAADRAAADVAAAALDADGPDVSLSADPASPSVRQLAETLLAPYGRVPLVVDPGRRAVRSWPMRRLLGRAGAGGDWTGFAVPWAALDRDDVAVHQTRPLSHDPVAAARTARHLRGALLELQP